MLSKGAKSSAEGLESALRLLARRDYGREEMGRKLKEKGFQSEEVEKILETLAAQGLLDDGRYAQHLATLYSREKLLGPQRIVQKLMQKGIGVELAKEVTARAEENLPSLDRLRKLLRAKLKGQGLDRLLPQQKRRLVNYLRQRGFPWEDISEALREAGGFSEE